MNALSPFVARMRELMAQRAQAKTAEERVQAEEQMAELIKAQSRGERVRPPRIDRDVRQLQTGESE